MLFSSHASPDAIALAAQAGFWSVCWTAWVAVPRLWARAPKLTLTQFLVVVPVIAALLAMPAQSENLALKLIAGAGVIQIVLGYLLAASFSTRPSAADALIGVFAGLVVLCVFTVWWGLMATWVG